jgi:hypothetical protein
MGNRQRIKGQTIQWAIDKGQTIQWSIEGQTIIVLSVLLSFVYCPLYCLSFYPLSIAHCIVCPLSIGIKGQTIQWAIDKGQTIQWAIEGQTMQWTYITMGNRQRIKGQTIQWAIDKGQTIQWEIDKGQTIPLLSFVYCPLYCLSFYALSIAHCIVCP